MLGQRLPAYACALRGELAALCLQLQDGLVGVCDGALVAVPAGQALAHVAGQHRQESRSSKG